ncbi:MAG: TonB-dependent receptor [Desulfobacterota bacterium]|nr:TonB-dependent receptor [Thermodesulfobacteriota bacterium]
MRIARGRIFHKKWYDDKSYGSDGSIRYTLGTHEMRFGFDYTRFKDDGAKRLHKDTRGPLREPNYVNSETFGLYVVDEIQITPKLMISPAIRYVSYDGNAGPSGKKERIKDIEMEGLSPSVRLTYSLTPRSLLYLTVAQVLRVPTPPEHYWHFSPDAGVYTGDLPLKKEHGFLIQAGWKSQLPSKTSVEVHPYYYRVKNYIHFDLINYVSYNIPKATLYGCEIEVAQEFKKGFSAFGNYSFQRSHTEDDPLTRKFLDPRDRDFDEIPTLP